GWWFTKIMMLLVGYWVILLIAGFFFGVFSFFWKFEKKVLSRFGFFKNSATAIPLLTEDNSYSIAIFASGAGSNAQKIIDHFRDHAGIRVALIVCNNTKAGVLSIAANEGIPVLLLDKEHFNHTGYVNELKQQKIDLIVLAGFLWKVPPILIEAFPKKIINIHPALLPSYGGKGMYGSAVHKAVMDAGEKESGITIHYVDEQYDQGNIIYQATCHIDENETPESLAVKIHALEHECFPAKIEQLINQMKKA